MLVYYGYTDIDIGAWWEGNQLNIFLTTKHCNGNNSGQEIIESVLLQEYYLDPKTCSKWLFNETDETEFLKNLLGWRILFENQLINADSQPIILYVKCWWEVMKVLILLPFPQFIEWSPAQNKDGVNTSSIWSPKSNCYCYNDALQNTKATVHSPNSDTDFFNSVSEILQGDIITLSFHNLLKSYTLNGSTFDEKK